MRLACVLTLVPTLAFAECPTGADLTTGIRVTEPDGATDTYTRESAHLVESQYRFEPGEGARSLLAQGIYMVLAQDVEAGTIVPGTRSTYTYPLPPEQMPIPEPGGSWTADVVTLDSEGIARETHVMTFGALSRITFGPCSYGMIPIEIRYGEEDGELLHYLPELGFALLGAYGVGSNRETYVYSKIEKVTP